jgi:hypothetical protein
MGGMFTIPKIGSLSSFQHVSTTLTGWWYTYPSEKHQSMGRIIPYILWKNKIHVPNHQSDINITSFLRKLMMIGIKPFPNPFLESGFMKTHKNISHISYIYPI